MKKVHYVLLAVFSVCLIAIIITLFDPPQVDPQQGYIQPAEEPSQAQQTASKQDEIDLAVTQDTEQDIIDTLPLREAAKGVAAMYEQSLRSPPYSQPLNPADFDRLNPNHFYPVEMPVGNTQQKIALSLNKYRFIHPDKVQILVQGDITTANAELFVIDEKKQLAEVQLVQTPSGWVAELAGNSTWPIDLNLLVRANTNSGQPVALTASFKYYQPSATLLSVGKPSAQGPNMEIPIELDVKAAGTFRIRANLFDTSDTPISHLVTREKLDEGKQTVMLKAHHTVLAGHLNSDNPETMRLKTFVIEKVSPRPGEVAQFGDSKIQQQEIRFTDFNLLSNAPYKPNEAEQRRLQYLQNMASKK
ncbi:hypothetical protein ACSLBF_05180 [Pseudoalteromonas sp. T1lg65]|uniref:hypothetical protein n=1 Tax=Pseudoalteromonas sp. T1lg65 TaxID=2077101 RepID=UPI003F79A6A6